MTTKIFDCPSLYRILKDCKINLTGVVIFCMQFH